MNGKKLWIDTDVGDDIDDTLALVYALRAGFSLAGISTVFGDTVSRARFAETLLRAMGEMSVSVFAGHGTPLCGRTPASFPTYLCQCDGGRVAEGDPEAAVDALLTAARTYGKELILLGLGPFTNLARAVEKDRDALSRIGGIVVMGGAFFRPYADWNVFSDPEAAKVLFEAGLPLFALGADVTHRLTLSEEESAGLLADPLLGPYYRRWQDVTGKRAVLHDPLTLLYLEDPGLCEMEEATVRVVTEGEARGLTLTAAAYGKAGMNPAWNGGAPSKVAVARTVLREKAVERFMKRVR